MERDLLDHRLRPPIVVAGLQHRVVGGREFDELIGAGAERQHLGRADILGMLLELLFLKMKPAIWAAVYRNWTFGAFSLTVTSSGAARLDRGDRAVEGRELRAEIRFHVDTSMVATTSSGVRGLPSPKVTPLRSVTCRSSDRPARRRRRPDAARRRRRRRGALLDQRHDGADIGAPGAGDEHGVVDGGQRPGDLLDRLLCPRGREASRMPCPPASAVVPRQTKEIDGAVR